MNDNLHIVITEQVVTSFPRLKPLKGKKFFLRKIMAESDGCCILSNRPYFEGHWIGHARIKEGDKTFNLTAKIAAIEKQLEDETQGVGFHKIDTPVIPGVNPYRIPQDMVSDEQEECIMTFEHDTCNLIMESRAGGGKTTMLKDLASRAKTVLRGNYNHTEKFIYMAFNRKNAKEGAQKLPRTVPSMTTHSFMGGVIRDNGFNIPNIGDKNKTMTIINDIFPHLKNNRRKKIRRTASKLTALSKAYAVRPGDTAQIQAVMEKFGFDLEQPEDYPVAINLTNEILELSLPTSKYGLKYNFDDMLWWPIVLDMKMPQYDCVFADECQDFNICQIEMMMRLALAGSRLVIVGDPFQAVYRFRGADSEAFNKLCKVLQDDNRKAKRVLLPTNYRCSKSGIAYVVANTYVKDIKAHDNAPEGMVRVDMTYRQIMDMLIEEQKLKGVA